MLNLVIAIGIDDCCGIGEAPRTQGQLIDGQRRLVLSPEAACRNSTHKIRHGFITPSAARLPRVPAADLTTQTDANVQDKRAPDAEWPGSALPCAHDCPPAARPHFDRVEMSEATFRDVDLSGARFERAALNGAVMRGIELVDVQISAAITR